MSLLASVVGRTHCITGTLSLFCLTWACLFAVLVGRGWPVWTSLERQSKTSQRLIRLMSRFKGGIVMYNLLSYTIGSLLFYLMYVRIQSLCPGPRFCCSKSSHDLPRAIVVFRPWWDLLRAGLLSMLLSGKIILPETLHHSSSDIFQGSSAVFAALEPSLPCTLGMTILVEKLLVHAHHGY